jgi:N-acetylglucosaminyldiphosphoundecaprenol N-acetyl-beta-D-mannosaminyltransferase
MPSPQFALPSRDLAGIPLVQCEPTDAARELCRLAEAESRSHGLSFHLVNAYTVSLTSKDANYRELIKSATARFPDGKPLTWWKLDQGQRLNQIRGPQLFEKVMDLGREAGIKHYLLGATEETLSLLEATLKERYPGVDIVGSFSPPFRKMTSQEVDAQDQDIQDSGADIVWVGLGTPKQDWEVARLANRLPILSLAVGAAFDFSAGTKREAPAWMSALTLEWLFRLLSEPRRLWKRYLFGNLVFLWTVLGHYWRKPFQSRLSWTKK